ncbi:hypothetical protein B7494_g1069 [Chlorociboria aeruginascens]|nr:hypothetical protein B7494_g1069 [Chlorociboria aeruginascens]
MNSRDIYVHVDRQRLLTITLTIKATDTPVPRHSSTMISTSPDPVGEDESMPIAIVGIGCRMPGDATSPDKLWDFIAQGRNAYSEVPRDRFNINAFYHPSPERHGTVNARGGYYLKDPIDIFDAPFFSITPNEAKSMDPQQRLLLEVTYESLENAGIPMERVLGSQTSCFIGCFTRDYAELLDRDVDDRTKYAATGTGTSIISNRVSWFYDFKGPSMTIDTACSSSLVALHLACQSLRTGESKMALVGGTNVILDVNTGAKLGSLNFLSPDSKCQSFDHKANGYARGEGFACIVLKPLDFAIRDNDVIRAVIRGSAVNQDGKTPGITLPSMQAQEELIKTAYLSAGLSMSDTAYFEAHGTGTPAGDPLEAGALARTIATTRDKDKPLLIGSIKSNIGHTEGASGMAGLIKAIYILEKGLIPPNLWFEKANSRIPMDEWNIKVPTELTPYPVDGLRRISVNSFGYGGTNAHVIVDDAFHYLKKRGLHGHHNVIQNKSLRTVTNEATNVDSANFNLIQLADNNGWHDSPPQPKLFVWTAHEQAGVERLGRTYADYLKERDRFDGQLLERLAYTLASRRSILAWKSFCIATSTDELYNNLSEGLVAIQRASHMPRLAFVFTGQGAQWYAMGRELLSYQAFRSSLEDADVFFKSLGCPWSLLNELSSNEISSNVNRAAYSQPMCTALQIALIELLRTWGVAPVAVIGHSSGEIAAAFTKGSISRQSAWTIAFHRGRLAEELAVLAPHLHGSMLAAGMDEVQASDYLQRVSEGQVLVACINSPSSVTISGDAAGIDQLHDLLKADGIFSRKLKVETAYHSHHMKTVAELYLTSLQHVETLPGNPDVIMFSSVTGNIIGSRDLGPLYWVDNMISPVKFYQATQSLFNYSTKTKKRRREAKPFADILLEIGPHGALQGPIKQIIDEDETRRTSLSYLSLLRRGEDAAQTALDVAGKLFTRGYNVDVARANSPAANSAPHTALLVDLPSYPWNRMTRYWSESYLSSGFRFRKHPRHDLLGAPTADYTPIEPRWRHIIRKTENPWVQDHKVQSSVLYPAAGMITMGIEAARQVADEEKIIKGYEIRDFNIGKAIVLPQHEDGIETIVRMKPWKLGSQASTAVWQEFSIISMTTGQGWQDNCSGLIITHYEKPLTPNEIFEEQAAALKFRKQYLQIREHCTFNEVPSQIYESLDTIGLQYGPTFQNLVSIQSGDHKSVGVLRIPNIKFVMPEKYLHDHIIHPTTLDNVFQMAITASTGMKKQLKAPMVPTFIQSLYISSIISSEPGHELHGYSHTHEVGFRQTHGSATMWGQDDLSIPQIILEGMHTTALSAMTDGFMSTPKEVSSIRKLCFSLCWREDVDLVNPSDFDKILNTEIHASHDTILDLELAAFVYIRRIVSKFSPEKATDFAPHLKLLYDWAQEEISRALKGEISYQDGGLDWMNLDSEYERELLQRVSSNTIDGRMLCRLGERADSMLEGEIDALQLMLEDDLLYDYYRDSAGPSDVIAYMKSYMDIAAHKQPGMKILEIGAGTGGSTLPILQALSGNDESSRFSSYTFTDISTGFFEKAQDLMKPWEPYMTYKRLNIEEDPASQGFQLGSYDIVIASYVLHATPNIDRTLAHVRSLLKPDGKLLLGEITYPKIRANMIFGWLPGWWLGEADGRKGGPTLTEDQWNTSLRRQGFTGTDICIYDQKAVDDRWCAFMVSTASPRAPAKAPPKVVIVYASVCTEDENFANQLAAQFSQGGTGPITCVVSLKDICLVDLTNANCIVVAELHRPIMLGIGQEDFESIKILTLTSSSVLWVSRGGVLKSTNPEANMFVGIARSIRSEHAGVKLTNLDLEAGTSSAEDLDTIVTFFQKTNNLPSSMVQDREYAARKGVVYIPRVVAQKEVNDLLLDQSHLAEPVMQTFAQPDRPIKLEIGVPGMLDTLQFVDDLEASMPLGDDDVEIRVMASALNFHDIMTAMNQIPDSTLGDESSGIVTKIGKNVTNFQLGDRVNTWKMGSHRTFVRNPSIMFQHIPDDMSFEVASSIPIIYSTIYISFIDVARLQKGETVLIHAAAGGVGQAAIMIAKYLGAEIFATVGSEEKKKLIMNEYDIPEDHIFDSRNLSFVKGIKRMTNERGVDVVLNSTTGEALRESWNCIAMFGRFIEIGKKDIYGNTGLDMAPFIKSLTFASVNLPLFLSNNITKAAAVHAEVMSLIREGAIRAVTPLNIYSYSEMEKAFRTMQAGNHMGKIILKPSDHDLVPIVPSRRQAPLFGKEATYILAGGLGGLGRSIAKWMVDRGAVNLVFLSRSGAKKEAAQQLVEELTHGGANISVFTCDIGNRVRLQEVIVQCRETLPPIKGVIQGAMALKDSTIDNMTSEDFAASVRPKVVGSWNLHNLLPKDMDFFVMLSSTAGVVGSICQGNYNAGNTYQDALASFRNANCLPATSIDLGVVLGVGFVAENFGDNQVSATRDMKAQGMIGIREEELLIILSSAITGYGKGDIHIPSQIITGMATGGMLQQSGGGEEATLNKDPKFAILNTIDMKASTAEASSPAAQLQYLLAEVTSVDSAAELICRAITTRLADTMQIAVEDLDSSKPINAYGVDSLVAVEMKNWIFREIKADISIFDILSNVPIMLLGAKIAGKSTLIPAGVMELQLQTSEI